MQILYIPADDDGDVSREYRDGIAQLYVSDKASSQSPAEGAVASDLEAAAAAIAAATAGCTCGTT
jgi:signal transduction histidine kinase